MRESPSSGGCVNKSLTGDFKGKVVGSNPCYTEIVFSISMIAECVEQWSKSIPEGIDMW